MPDRRVIYPALTARIGELFQQADLVAKQRALGWIDPDLELILCWNERWTNKCALDYISDVFEVVRTEAQMKEAQDLFNEGKKYDPSRPMFPSPAAVSSGAQTSPTIPLATSVIHIGPDDGAKYYDEDRACVAINKVWDGQHRTPIFQLKEAHARSGRAYLSKLGVPEDAWFVTLHVRTSHFITNILAADNDPGDEGHNDYRNADIRTYREAVNCIVDAGGWVIRIGDDAMPPLWEQEHVIDYATRLNQLAWMDVYLCCACRFMLCTTSGPWIVAQAFGTPVCQTNSAPFSERPFSSRDLYIPKLFIEGDKPLLFKAALAPPLRHHYNGYSFPKMGLILRDNSPKEILDVTKEMLDMPYIPSKRQLQYNGMCGFEDFGVASHMGDWFLSDWRDLMP